MNRNILLAGILLLVFAAVVLALTEGEKRELADSYYNNALIEYNSTNCKNASEYANKALILYSELNNDAGIQKSNELILKINKCLRDAGYAYYSQALEYFKINDYVNAKVYAEKAKEFYSYIPDTDEIAKCDKLIYDANWKIIEDKKRVADDNYKKASDLYFSIPPDYINSRILAQNSLLIYQEINDADGILKTEALIDKILKGIVEIKENADITYTEANEYYKEARLRLNFDNYKKALEYAKKAKDLYSMINDSDGFSKALDLINLIESNIKENEDLLKQQADKYYEKAQVYFLYDDLENASIYIENAKSGYYELYLMVEKMVEDWQLKESKKKLYLGLIAKSDEFIDRINKTRKEREIKAQAELLYDDANRLFNYAEYENASIVAKQAKDLFSSIGSYTGISKSDTLIIKINKKIELMNTAREYYNKSYDYYIIADFDNATLYLNKSREIYNSIGRSREVAMTDSFMKNITIGIGKKTEADNYYRNAVGYYNSNSYENSLVEVKKAKRIYSEINYATGISNTDALILNNEKRIREIEQSQSTYRTILVLAVVVVILIIIFGWMIEKKRRAEKKRREIEEQRLKEELEKAEKIKEEREREEKRIRELDLERQRLKDLLEKEKRILDNRK